MGEIAEMMLDGTLCAGCGVALVDSPDQDIAGIPTYCSRDCEPDGYRISNKPKKIKCPTCGKKCGGQQGLKAHTNAVHN